MLGIVFLGLGFTSEYFRVRASFFILMVRVYYLFFMVRGRFLF